MGYVKYYGDGGLFKNKKALPFNVKINFKRAFEFWEEEAQSTDKAVAERAKAVLKKLEKTPELRESITDESVLDKYSEETALLLSPMFPKMLGQNEIKAACVPFEKFLFNVSSRLNNILDNAGEIEMRMRRVSEEQLYVAACVFILNFKYGAGINHKGAMYFDIPDAESGVMKHYRVFFNGDFSSFTPKKSFKALSAEEIRELTDNFDNYELWKEKIPPGSFDYEGFALMTIFDVTSEEAMSSLKNDLLKKDALQAPDTVETIRENLGAMLNVSDLKLGFATFDEDRQSLKSLGYGLWNSVMLSDKSEKKATEAFCEYSYPLIFQQRKVLTISKYDEKLGEVNEVANKLIKHELRSYLAAPLVYNDQIIGIMEMGSQQENAINSVIAAKMEEVIPLFTTALKRSIEELETKLEAIIQEKCTAIHPTVSWRFFEAAENLYRRQRFYDTNTMEEIVFNEVVPLYGQSDIKSSSTLRNNAIQADLIEQFNLAKSVLNLTIERMDFPVYHNLRYRIDQYIEKTRERLGAGDELKALEFLKREIYPVFDHVKELDEGISEAVKAYQQALDPELEVIYKERKAYEDSVTAMNNKIADFLEKAQEEAQGMFPHYFERYKTDGVEYNIYIGQSLVNHRDYNEIYLQNLRLWQLKSMIEVENAVHRLRPQLPMSLEVCSLILVHSNPMSIRFRQDEKQFDVDGAYNVRYEIVKKRIDKAYVKGTNERLTQPRKIAIVYSRDEELQEYQNYVKYLQSIGYIKENVEILDLENMPGVNGLKALRVEVDYKIEEKRSPEASKRKARKLAKVEKN